MSLKLRELIRNVRSCKTAADERNIISKESAAIRSAFGDGVSKFRHRNVAKLVFMHLLGYPTHFGQVEAVNLVASHKFSEKRVGYLALNVLLDEDSEVLMMATNSHKTDLSSKNQFVVGLALTSLANMGSVDMLRALCSEVALCFTNKSSYVRKKAAMCAIRMVRRVPDLWDVFLDPCQKLLGDSQHSVLLSAATLAMHLCTCDARCRARLAALVPITATPSLTKMLKSMVVSGFSPEYEISGVADPFLQVTLLRLLRLLGSKSRANSEAMSDVLASVATNTQITGHKLSGFAVLYECVQTIMFIESEPSLRTMAINILAKLLQHPDNNLRYVALQTLAKIADIDPSALQRHRNTVVDCLRDQDISIRNRALQLIYLLVNAQNVKPLVKELLAYVLVADADFRQSICTNIAALAEKFAPDAEWYVDTISELLSSAGQYAADEIAFNLVSVVGRQPNLQEYAVRKLYESANLNMDQQILAQCASFCLGEYGDLLSVSISPEEIVGLLEAVVRRPNVANRTLQFVLNACIKLLSRLPRSVEGRLKKLLAAYRQHLQLELQQRSVEYTAMSTRCPDDQLASLTDRVPVPDETSAEAIAVALAAPVETVPLDSGAAGAAAAGPGASPLVPDRDASVVTSLIDDLLGGSSPTAAAGGAAKPPQQQQQQKAAAPAAAAAAKPAAAAASQGAGLVAPKTVDLLSGSPAKPTGREIDDLLSLIPEGASGSGAAAAATPAAAALRNVAKTVSVPPAAASSGAPANGASANGGAAAAPEKLVYDQDGLQVFFRFERVPTHPTVTTVHMRFVAMAKTLTNFVFQAAVPKFIKLQINTPSGTVLAPNTPITQTIRLANQSNGEKALAMRMKIDFDIGNEHKLVQSDFRDFPKDKQE